MTCYAMDVMLNCYGGRNQPKFSHLGNLHRSIALVAPQLLAQAKPIVVPLLTDERSTLGGGAAEELWSLGSLGNGSADCSSAGILQWAQHPAACSGLTLDPTAANDSHRCAINCCQDPKCVLWQMEPGPQQQQQQQQVATGGNGPPTGSCWRGKPSACLTKPLKPASGVRPGAKLPPPSKPPGPPGGGGTLQAAVYNSTGLEVVILSNLADSGSTDQRKDKADAVVVRWRGGLYTVLGGSCVLVRDGEVIFNSSIDSDGPTAQDVASLQPPV